MATSPAIKEVPSPRGGGLGWGRPSADETHIPENVAEFDAYVERFPLYLRGQKGLSENTERVYLSDLQAFREYLLKEGLTLRDMERNTLRGYWPGWPRRSRKAAVAMSGSACRAS